MKDRLLIIIVCYSGAKILMCLQRPTLLTTTGKFSTFAVSIFPVFLRHSKENPHLIFFMASQAYFLRVLEALPLGNANATFTDSQNVSSERDLNVF